MFDTHCHLTDPRLLSQIAAVIDRAKSVGVHKMVTIGTDLNDARAAIEVSQKFPAEVRCAIGIHPNYVEEAKESDLEEIKPLLADPTVVAYGEIGLDYFHKGPREKQRAFFEKQIVMACEANLPVVIHSREAVDDTLAMLRGAGLKRVVFHCFTGNLAEAEKIVAEGYWLGFTGPITFKKNDLLREIVRSVPIDRMLMETDAPYLSPEPMRKQQTNEPALVVHTARVAGREKGMLYDEFDRVMTANAERFYDWV